ncbi:MAG: BBP7 family outer membrane beta-barrel protein, partial [Pirellulales bacterium]
MASDRTEHASNFPPRSKHVAAIVRWASGPLALVGLLAGAQGASAQTTFDQLLGLYPPRYPAHYSAPASHQAKRSSSAQPSGPPSVAHSPANSTRGPGRTVSYAPSKTQGEPRQIKASPAKVVRQAPPPPFEGEMIEEGPGPMWEGEHYDGNGGCYNGCWGPCRPVGLWIRAEYLAWSTRGWRVPALVTTAPTTGTGALNDPSTTVLFGNTDINDDVRSGGRIWVGRNFICNSEWGWELNYFNSGEETTEFSQGPIANALVTRPFFNIRPDTGLARDDAELVSDPGELDGTVSVDLATEFQGGEVLLRHAICDTCDFRFDVLGGYRFARLDDSLRVQESLRVLSGTGGQVIGTTIDLFDLFDTQNEFHGVDLGMVAHYRNCRWSMDLTMKLALGNTSTTVLIDGATTNVVPGAGGGTATSAGGLLTQSSNIGTRDQ